ncbi:hypothetical protein ANCDUO_24077, partial [Ancylostoma duodenale]
MPSLVPIAIQPKKIRISGKLVHFRECNRNLRCLPTPELVSGHKYIRESYRLRGQNITEDTVALVKGAVINCWFIVMVFGACCTPYITDTLGRKIGYIIAVVVAIVAAIIQYVSVLFHLPEVFILGRSMTAFCSPLADACLLLYLQEVSPLSIRGMASFLCEIGYGAMVVLGM